VDFNMFFSLLKATEEENKQGKHILVNWSILSSRFSYYSATPMYRRILLGVSFP
jgi:hypothetical protein